jgi:hypothetical protein
LRIKARSSAVMRGRGVLRLFQCQYRRKPRRCQPTTVLG